MFAALGACCLRPANGADEATHASADMELIAGSFEPGRMHAAHRAEAGQIRGAERCVTGGGQ